MVKQEFPQAEGCQWCVLVLELAPWPEVSRAACGFVPGPGTAFAVGLEVSFAKMIQRSVSRS